VRTTHFLRFGQSFVLITCYKIKDIARELKKRKKRNSFLELFLIRWSSTSRENSLIVCLDEEFVNYKRIYK
jgi:hypothetical protein